MVLEIGLSRLLHSFIVFVCVKYVCIGLNLWYKGFLVYVDYVAPRFILNQNGEWKDISIVDRLAREKKVP